MSPRIGFIGLGMMGHGMAKNLLAKGFAVMAMAHRNRSPLEDLLSQGATEGETPKALAEQNDIVIVCVTGSPQVETVVYGEQGLLEGCRDGLVVIDCSTSEPASTLRIDAELAARGAILADAPLARTPIEAEAGRLNTMVGASEETYAQIRPVLEAFCENIFHVGPVGAGHKTKLVNNFLAMGHAALIAEALCACSATGVDASKFYDVVSAGGANSGIFQLIVPKALEGDFTGLRFSLTNAEKDLRYYRQMIEAASLAGTLGKGVHQVLADGVERGFGDNFVGSLIEVLAETNGIDPAAAKSSR